LIHFISPSLFYKGFYNKNNINEILSTRIADKIAR